MKKGVVILIIVAIIAGGVGIYFLTNAIRFYKPDWLKEIIAISSEYIESNEMLIDEYGENFHYTLNTFQAKYDEKTGEGYYISHFTVESDKYIVEYEAVNFEWTVKDLYRDFSND